MGGEGGSRWVSIRVLVAAVSVVLLAAIALVPALASALAGSDRVAQGVHSMGRDFGNLKREEVAAAVKAAFEDNARRPHRVLFGSAELSLTAAELGAAVDVEATARRIIDTDPVDSFSERIANIVGRYSQQTVPPVVTVDPVRLDTALGKLASAVDRPARNPELRILPDGVSLLPGQNARRLDRAETGERLLAVLSAGTAGDVEAVVRESPPTVSDAQWHAAAELARRIMAKPIHFHNGQRSWTLGQADLARLLIVEPPGDAAGLGVVRWDEAGLRAFVERIAREVDVAATEARVERLDGSFVAIEGSAGLKVDVGATVAALKQVATNDNRDIPLSVTPVPPLVQASDWAEAVALANHAVSAPLKLIFRNQAWSLSPAEIAAMITFTRTQESTARHAVVLDDRQLSRFVSAVAKQIDRPKRDARFKLLDGKVTMLADSQEGLAVDAVATATAIARQVFGEHRTIEATVISSKPEVLSSDVDKITFPDPLMEATTSYAGSIPERAHNIQLAAARLNGTLVPPGGVFSFNASVGPTTLAAGYQIGYGIALQGSRAVTVPSEAGGICQVATTLFHAVFWSGLPIVERQSHLYWIPRYGTPPRGMRGLDATVDDPYVDFKFRNTTPGWLLVEAGTDGQNVRFALRGTKPGWEVKIDAPVITGLVKASQAAVRQEDPSKPKGWELWIEHAEDGFTARIRRTVTQGGRIIDASEVVSRYRPSQNVLLVGTKAVAPTPAPQTTPATTNAPMVTPQATATVAPRSQ